MQVGQETRSHHPAPVCARGPPSNFCWLCRPPAPQDVLLHIILEFWTWRGSQPLTEDMLDRLLRAPGPERRRRALLQAPADAAGDQWWPDAVAVPQTARTVGILAYGATRVVPWGCVVP